LENFPTIEPRDQGLLTILAELERQLVELDRVEARIAAAYVDAAIEQLRLDMSKQ